MSDELWAKIIDASGPILGALATGICLIIVARISKIHRQINSRMDELVALEKRLSKLEGRLQGNIEGRAEMKVEQEKIAVALLTPVPGASIAVIAQGEMLEKIEENTKNISEHTKPKTE